MHVVFSRGHESITDVHETVFDFEETLQIMFRIFQIENTTQPCCLRDKIAPEMLKAAIICR